MQQATKDAPNLDLLRTFAVSFVLIDHLLEFLGHRYIGPVDMHQVGILGVLFFFVHTALVLMMSLERLSAGLGGWMLFASFYIRRFFRIYPLAAAFLIFIVCLKIPSARVSPFHLDYVPADPFKFIANLALVQNLTHHYRGNIIGQYWSLPLEVQMYAMLPFLFVALRRIKDAVRSLVLCLAIAAGFAWLQGTEAHIQIMEYIPNFIGGVVAYVLVPVVAPRLGGAAWIATIVVLSAAYILHPTQHAGWAVCLTMGAAIPFYRQITLAPLVHFAKTAAKYSYGVYISHFLCIWVAFGQLRTAPALVQWTVFVTMLCGISYGMYRWIEKPGMDLGARLAAKLGPVTRLRSIPGSAGPRLSPERAHETMSLEGMVHAVKSDSGAVTPRVGEYGARRNPASFGKDSAGRGFE